jgi:hypothetical protein
METTDKDYKRIGYLKEDINETRTSKRIYWKSVIEL